MYPIFRILLDTSDFLHLSTRYWHTKCFLHGPIKNLVTLMKTEKKRNEHKWVLFPHFGTIIIFSWFSNFG